MAANRDFVQTSFDRGCARRTAPGQQPLALSKDLTWASDKANAAFPLGRRFIISDPLARLSASLGFPFISDDRADLALRQPYFNPSADFHLAGRAEDATGGIIDDRVATF